MTRYRVEQGDISVYEGPEDPRDDDPACDYGTGWIVVAAGSPEEALRMAATYDREAQALRDLP